MSEPSAARRGPYAKSAARRQHIVEQAYAMFATRGFRASSMREIAAAAGISLSSLQHHFTSKEELLVAVLARRDQVGGDARRTVDGGAFPEYIVNQASANRGIPGLIALYAVLSAEAVTDGHPGREYFVDRYEGLRAAYTAEFALLHDAGRLRDGVDPAIAAATVIALWEGMELQWLYAADSVDTVKTLRSYLDVVVLP